MKIVTLSVNLSKTIIRQTRLSPFLWGLLLLLTLGSCSINPVTGKRQPLVMSEEREVALGKQSDPQVVAAFGLYEDQKLQQYINAEGQRMAAVSHRPDLKFTFRLLDSPVVNAFALPGGYVYFTRGIMAHFSNEAEFAGVLGHEIGHVTGRHGALQQRNQILSQVGLIAGIVLSPEIASMANEVAQGVQLLMLRNSREHESESDKLGVEYSTAVGYDANQMANFFQTISRLSGGASQQIPTFMSTHPNPLDRYDRVHRLADKAQAESGKTNLEIGRESYLKMIDGLKYGEDPRQGYVENNVFYHPELKFEFPVPRNWTVNNTPQQVQIVPKEGDGAMIFTFAPGNTLREAGSQIVQQYQLTVEGQQDTRINGFPALVIKSKQTNAQSGQSIDLLSTLIQDGQSIFVFHGIATPQRYNGYRATFERTMNGYARLTDQSKINVQPERISVVTVSRGGTLESVLRANGISGDRIEEFSIVNGMKKNEQVPAGTMIKVLQRGR
ncbi:MAG: M48 family metalloprotease [Bacteroidota bacterium]